MLGGKPMTALMHFLKSEREYLIAQFTRRWQQGHPALSPEQAHVPLKVSRVLDAFAQNLSQESLPSTRFAAEDMFDGRGESDGVSDGPRQDVAMGLSTRAEALRLLHEVILDHVEARELQPTVRELRVLGSSLAQADAALRASRERYRALFESIDDGFCVLQMIFDAEGTPRDYVFLEANATFARHTGLENAIGKTALELVPDLDVSWFQLYGRVAVTGESLRFENHAPAMHRWFEVFASRVGDPAQHQVALVFKDITERKRLEAESERLLALETDARRSAEEANRLKDEFLATVSHELRTPLNAMMGWAHLLRAGRLSEEKRERALETIERNARAQAKLIEDLLDTSRILAGKLNLQVALVDIHTIVAQAVETVLPSAEAKEIALDTVLGSERFVMGDAHRLQQVAWNLLSNAVKFTPRGGRIHVRVEALGGRLELSVSDSGQGISEEFQPHVFERFRQADGGTTRAQGGLGLGLAIVRQLVELHGGTVTVISEGAGRGSRFTVRLPLPQNEQTDSASASKPSNGFAGAPDLSGLRALVVDDEEDTRDMLCAVLEMCGAQVTLAGSASEALHLFELAPPDVLLSDIGMPDQDGYALIAQIRDLPGDKGGRVPAVALTAYARTDDRTRALVSGFNTYVPKPVEPLELTLVIASLVGTTTQPHA